MSSLNFPNSVFVACRTFRSRCQRHDADSYATRSAAKPPSAALRVILEYTSVRTRSGTSPSSAFSLQILYKLNIIFLHLVLRFNLLHDLFLTGCCFLDLSFVLWAPPPLSLHSGISPQKARQEEGRFLLEASEIWRWTGAIEFSSKRFTYPQM